MAKGKALNPAEAHRKNQRKKEVQKNREARKKARALTSAKQDTGPIEEEIESIEAKPNLSPEDKGKLSSLRAELKRLLKAKEDYLKEHPEHRALVYASAHKRQKGEATSRAGDPTDRKVFGKDGLPLRPERSIYYDPVLNPYGIPPPGMLYMERPATPDESQMVEPPDGDELSSEDDEDDIPMPLGPPPGGYSDASSDEEGRGVPTLPPGFIPPLPKGPPPPNAVLAPGFVSPAHFPPPPPPVFLNAPCPPPPPPPPGFPSVLPLNRPSPYATANLPPGFIPPPPFGFPNFTPLQLRDFPGGATGPTYHADPLSIHDGAISQPYQSTPILPSVGAPSPLPKRPTTTATTTAKPTTNAPLALDDTSGVSTIVAAPELRDFKKEATAFVPRGIRQKAQVANVGPRANAAPMSTGGGLPTQGSEESQRPDLMQAPTNAGITGASAPAPSGRVETEEPPKTDGNQE